MSEETGAKRDLSVRSLKGISTNRAKQLARLDIYTLGDLASHFPRRYEDWTSLSAVNELQDGEDGVFLAQVARVPSLFRKGRRSYLQTMLRDPSGTIKAMWFNQPYLQDKIHPYEIYLFRGRIKRQGRNFVVYNPAFELQPEAEYPVLGTSMAESVADTFVRPIYPTTAGLGQNFLRGLVERALALCLPEIEETLPASSRKAYHLADRVWSYSKIHQPANLEEYRIARRRLAFDELLMLQLGLRLSKAESLRRKAEPIDLREHLEAAAKLKQSLEALPFELTGDQKRCLQDIFRDMAKPYAMNRLVQGDVGSGKTIVAFLAMHAAALCGRQTVLMAPTGILAEQHAKSLRKLFPEIPEEQFICLTGKQTAAQKRAIYKRIAEGEILYLIGTHAVLQKGVEFKDLALAVTDEQHRFGVKQRLRLSESGGAHVLVMSATPIPRTLGLILYGDLDVSVISEKPPGRLPIRTYTARTKDYPRLLALIRREAARGGQSYVVCPMVEENADQDLLSAEALYKQLAEEDLPELSVGLVHGRLKEKDKQETMERFLAGEIQVLTATTVIEVGVDNPRANLMIIMNAERFGLAQLHQLRGRIGRGSEEALCVLQSDVGEGTARERLTALCRSEDGFEIAEEDLRLRGPGDFFGTRQHGLPTFRLANLYEDQELLACSAELLSAILRDDPDLKAPEHRALRRESLAFLDKHRE